MWKWQRISAVSNFRVSTGVFRKENPGFSVSAALQTADFRGGPTANVSRTAAVIVHPLGPSTGRYDPLCVYKSVNCSLSQWRGSAKRLPLGEAGTPIGSSQPIGVTDEGNPAVQIRLNASFSQLPGYPSSVTSVRTGDTFPQGKACLRGIQLPTNYNLPLSPNRTGAVCTAPCCFILLWILPLWVFRKAVPALPVFLQTRRTWRWWKLL